MSTTVFLLIGIPLGIAVAVTTLDVLCGGLLFPAVRDWLRAKVSKEPNDAT